MRYLVVLMLAGCATPEHQAATEQAHIEMIVNQCAKLGARTMDQMTQCAKSLKQANVQ